MADINGSAAASVEQFGYKQELKRTLGVRDLVIFGMVFMSPSSCMSLFGLMSIFSGGHNVLCYSIGFVAMLFTALSYGQMVQAFPVAGSVYSYAQRGIHPALGFVAGWTIILDYFMIPCLLYLMSALYANALVPVIPVWGWILIYIIPCTLVNIIGVEVAAKVNFVIAGLLILASAAFVVAAIRYGALGIDGARLAMPTAIFNPATFSTSGLLQGSILAVLSYLGFDAITTLSEEAEESSKKIGQAIIIACVVQTVIYLALSYFGTVVAPDMSVFADPTTAFFDMCMTVGGAWLQIFITLVILVAGFATALVGQTAASRVLYGMGRDSLLPKKFFAYLHPKYKTPTYNVLLMGAVGLIGANVISVDLLSNLVTFGGLFGFICVNLAVIIHYFVRQKSGKFFRHILFPVIGIIICVAIMMIGMIPLARIVGFAWMAVGIIYLIVRSAKPEFRELLKNITISE